MLWLILSIAHVSAIQCKDAELVECLNNNPHSQCFQEFCDLQQSNEIMANSLNLIQSQTKNAYCDTKCVNDCSRSEKTFKECSIECNCYAQNLNGLTREQDIMINFEIPKSVFEPKPIEYIQESYKDKTLISWDKHKELENIGEKIIITGDSCLENCIISCRGKSGKCIPQCQTQNCSKSDEKAFDYLYILEVILVAGLLFVIGKRILIRPKKRNVYLFDESESQVPYIRF